MALLPSECTFIRIVFLIKEKSDIIPIQVTQRVRKCFHKKRQAISDLSYSVAGTGLEPVTFGL